jgi:hypothetical protein
MRLLNEYGLNRTGSSGAQDVLAEFIVRGAIVHQRFFTN